MKTELTALLALAMLATAAFAEPEVFDFKDPKGINNAGFKIDAPLEAVNGSASGIFGKVTFDPNDPASTKGKIVVASASLTVPNAMQQQHMRGANWLEVTTFPEITFESKQVMNAQTECHTTTADVQGTFTLKGVSKEMTIPVKFTYLKDMLGQRVPNSKGDLLVIRANFSIKRSDFNIQPLRMEDKVSDVIELTLSIAGASPK